MIIKIQCTNPIEWESIFLPPPHVAHRIFFTHTHTPSAYVQIGIPLHGENILAIVKKLLFTSKLKVFNN